MHLILTGATGTCGSAVLKHCLANPAITQLTVLSRRPVPQVEGQAKAKVVIHGDFTQYPQSILDQLKGAEGCVWALGTTSNGVKKDDYTRITYDYTMAAATAFASLSSRFTFVFVSGEGADPSERSSALFAKVKGRAEKDLYDLVSRHPSLRVFAARPGLIDPEGQHLKATPRTALEATSYTLLVPVLRRFRKGLIIGTDPLARALTTLAMRKGDPVPEGEGVEDNGRTLRNTALRRLGGV